MIAYHGNPEIKKAILDQLARHRDADEIIQGQYWKNGKGCAIGCTIHSGNHMEYEVRFGIPVNLARLEDFIFEGLPNALAKEWPIRFMGAIEPGADLSRVGWVAELMLMKMGAATPESYTRLSDEIIKLIESA